MKLSKELATKIFSGIQDCEKRIAKIKGDYVYIDIMDKEVYKTNKQNRLFHVLLQTFEDSGCHSFEDYDALRKYYKRVAGLVKRSGNTETEASWSDVTKENAKTVLDILIRDMDYSGVLGSKAGKKYEAILRGIGEFYDEIN